MTRIRLLLNSGLSLLAMLFMFIAIVALFCEPMRGAPAANKPMLFFRDASLCFQYDRDGQPLGSWRVDFLGLHIYRMVLDFGNGSLGYEHLYASIHSVACACIGIVFAVWRLALWYVDRYRKRARIGFQVVTKSLLMLL